METKCGHAIEGNSFSGKTTLWGILKSQFGYPALAEYYKFASPFPKFPPVDEAAAKSNVDHFLIAEKRMSARLVDIAAKSQLEPIRDRSPFTIICFQYAVIACLPGVPGAYEYAHEVFMRAYGDGQITLPRSLVLLTPSLEVFAARVRDRGRVEIAHLNDYSTTLTMAKYYRSVMTDMYKNASLEVVPTQNDAPRDALLIDSFIQSLK